MKNLTRLFGLVILTSLMMSCSQDPCLNKDQFVDSFDAFFKEFEKASEENELTDAQISSYQTRYEDMLENCYKKYKEELSVQERVDFWQASVRFYIEKEGGILNLRFDDDDKDPFKEYIAAEIEELADSSAHEFEKFLEDVLDEELPHLIDSFVDAVEEFGENLKNSLEEEKEK